MVSSSSLKADKDDDDVIEAFEWLTSPASLEPFLRAALLQPVCASQSNTDTSCCSLQQQQQCHVTEATDRRGAKVLHLGCGSSALGEYLLQDVSFGVQHVVNVDRDGETLERVQERWKQLQHANNETTGIQKQPSAEEQENEMNQTAIAGTMSFVKADFGAALMQEGADEAGRSSFGSWFDGGGDDDDSSSMLFDLIVDKSTLDCCLCSEQDATGLLLTVYQHLACAGVYLVVSFHHADFMLPLLEQLPGAEWDVQQAVLARQASVNDELGATTCDDHDKQPKEPEAAVSAWSTGSFQPDEHYRKTVNVFTCRRHRQNHPKDNDKTNRKQHDGLCWNAVQEHLIRVHDEWYQSQNPMLTPSRVESIRRRARAECCHTKNDDDKMVIMMTLPEAYSILFTDAEREHLSFEYFLQDWQAYCRGQHPDDDDIGMTMSVETALQFLEEMQ